MSSIPRARRSGRMPTWIIALIIRKIINAVTVMNAVVQFIRGGIIAVTARGPYGPIRALMGPILLKNY